MSLPRLQPQAGEGWDAGLVSLGPSSNGPRQRCNLVCFPGGSTPGEHLLGLGIQRFHRIGILQKLKARLGTGKIMIGCVGCCDGANGTAP